MSWLKLDDAMGEHRKTRRLLRTGGLQALGLHALALLHCSRYLTDGFVDSEFVEETMEAAKVKPRERGAIVDTLVAAGQWEPTDGGWLAHGYLEHNPSHAQVEVKRAKDAARKATGRNSQSAASPRGQNADGARTERGRRAESNGPVPSRPVLTSPQPPEGEWTGPPAKPDGARARDLAEYKRTVGAYAAWLLPEHSEPERTQNVEIALGWLRTRPNVHQVTNTLVAQATRNLLSTGTFDGREAA